RTEDRPAAATAAVGPSSKGITGRGLFLPHPTIRSPARARTLQPFLPGSRLVFPPSLAAEEAILAAKLSQASEQVRGPEPLAGPSGLGGKRLRTSEAGRMVESDPKGKMLGQVAWDGSTATSERVLLRAAVLNRSLMERDQYVRIQDEDGDRTGF